MADTLDVISLPSAKEAINMAAATTQHDTELARQITSVSRLLDDIVGPVVVRTVTAEIHSGGSPRVVLRERPVTSLTTVEEVATAGTITVLTAAAFGSLTDGYYAPPDPHDAALLEGVLHRRRSGVDVSWPAGNQTVRVTYQAGRYANTGAVAARFVETAGAVLRRLWKREAGAWAQAAVFFDDLDAQPGSGFFRVARPVIEEMLPLDVRGVASTGPGFA